MAKADKYTEAIPVTIERKGSGGPVPGILSFSPGLPASAPAGFHAGQLVYIDKTPIRGTIVGGNIDKKGRFKSFSIIIKGWPMPITRRSQDVSIEPDFLKMVDNKGEVIKEYYPGKWSLNPIPENWIEKGPLFWEYTGKIKQLPFGAGDTRPWVYIEYRNKPSSTYREGYWMFKQFPSGHVEKEHFKRELSTAVTAAHKFMVEINEGYTKKSKKNPVGCQYCEQLPIRNPEKSSKDILELIDLLDHVNALIAERTRYGTRTVDSNFGSYILEWSNGGAKWHVYGESWEIPAQSSKVLDANEIAVSKVFPGATRKNLEYLANNKYLANLPLYGGSFERIHKPDYTGVELPPVIKLLRDHNLPVSPEVQRAIEKKSTESNPEKKRVYVIVGRQLRMLKLNQDEEEIRIFFKSHPYAYVVMPPTKDQLNKWKETKEDVKATDGCKVKYNGYCKHGKPSWLIFMGMVHPPYKTLKKA